MTEEELKEYQRKEKKRAYMRQYYDTNLDAREKKRKNDREYSAKNKDKALERATNYYLNNQEYCKAKQARRHLEFKMKAVNILGGACFKCGYDHPAALQFHHRDPSTKSFSVTTKQMSTPKRFTWQMIEEEIAKCDLLCANCHAVKHSAWKTEDISNLRV